MMLFKKVRVVHDPIRRHYSVEYKRGLFTPWSHDSWVNYWCHEQGGPSHARPLSEEEAKNVAIKRAQSLAEQEVIWSA